MASPSPFPVGSRFLHSLPTWALKNPLCFATKTTQAVPAWELLWPSQAIPRLNHISAQFLWNLIGFVGLSPSTHRFYPFNSVHGFPHRIPIWTQLSFISLRLSHEGWNIQVFPSFPPAAEGGRCHLLPPFSWRLMPAHLSLSLCNQISAKHLADGSCRLYLERGKLRTTWQCQEKREKKDKFPFLRGLDLASWWREMSRLYFI